MEIWKFHRELVEVVCDRLLDAYENWEIIKTDNFMNYRSSTDTFQLSKNFIKITNQQT